MPRARSAGNLASHLYGQAAPSVPVRSATAFAWPAGFARVPEEEWTTQPVEALAENYDTVERHGWYDNLNPTVEELRPLLLDGHIVVDYSGGTGILIDRLLRAAPDRSAGFVNVDSSPKFLRLSLEKLRDHGRVAFRLIRYLKEHRRLQLLDEVLAGPLLDRRVDALVSTNAVHLYYDLDDTLRSWARVVAPGGKVHVQSGNIGRDRTSSTAWIIDDTVHAIAEAAEEIVREDPTFKHLRPLLSDTARLERYHDLRRKYFLPVRPLAHYVDALTRAGFETERIVRRAIQARVGEWFEFLAVYHEGILGWVGGAEKLEGRPATEQQVTERLALMRRAMARVFEGRDTFQAEWTYITCERP